MLVLVKACRIGPTYGSKQWTICPGCLFVQQQLTQRSFGLFPLCFNPKIRHFDLKSLDFSQFKPRNIIKTYLSQIIKSKLRKLEERKEKKVKSPSSRLQQGSSSSSPKIQVFLREFHHQVCGISLVDSFHPLGP